MCGSLRDVVDAAQLSGAARSAVVRPLSRAAERPCARPACPAPARATLTFQYAAREARLVGLTTERSPQAYDLCAEHASRTQPPHGWQLRDQRPEEERTPDVPPTTPADLGGERTVAVLAAALREVPGAVPARGARDRTAEVGPPSSPPRYDAAAAFPRPRGVLDPPPAATPHPVADVSSEDSASPVLGQATGAVQEQLGEVDTPGRRPRPVLAARTGATAAASRNGAGQAPGATAAATDW